MSFTLVFEGDIRAFKRNPFKTETPFGVPSAVSASDALAEIEECAAIKDRSHWQPIETAPRTGDDILLWDGTFITCGFWTHRKDVVSRTPSGWVMDFFTNREPTHWMPLPEPPQANSSSNPCSNPESHAE